MPQDSRDAEEEQYLSDSEYLNCRDGYDKAELEVSGRYDQWILTLSGGALAISITFIEKIAPKPITHTLWWLILAWFLFVVSLLAGLISLLTSQSAIREQRKELDKAYQNRKPPGCNTRKKFTRTTNILNWGSAWIFVAGVTCLCIFAVTNVPTQKEEQTHAKQQDKREAATVDQGLRAIGTTQENRIGVRPTVTTAKIVTPSSKGEVVTSGIEK